MAGTYIHLKLFTITWLPLAMSIVLIVIYTKKVRCILIHHSVLLGFADQSRKQYSILLFNPCYTSDT